VLFEVKINTLERKISTSVRINVKLKSVLPSKLCKGVDRKAFRGEGNGKKIKKSKIAVLSLFQGGNGKRPKNSKKNKNSTIKPLFCTIDENPGGGARPPAADAHEAMYNVHIIVHGFIRTFFTINFLGKNVQTYRTRKVYPLSNIVQSKILVKTIGMKMLMSNLAF